MYLSRKPFFFCLVLAGGLISPLFSPAQETAAPKKLKALDSSLIDASVDPCVNFYQYSCGGWLKQNPIPADHSSYGRDSQLTEQNELVLKSILERAAAGGQGRTPNE